MEPEWCGSSEDIEHAAFSSQVTVYSTQAEQRGEAVCRNTEK